MASEELLAAIASTFTWTVPLRNSSPFRLGSFVVAKGVTAFLSEAKLVECGDAFLFWPSRKAAIALANGGTGNEVLLFCSYGGTGRLMVHVTRFRKATL